MKAGMIVAAFVGGTMLAWAGGDASRVQAQPAPAAASSSGDMLMATGGCTANTNDIAWVLTKDSFEDPKTKKTIERKVLLCYKVGQNGKLLDIVDVRDITFDSKFMQLPIAGHNGDFSPQHMRDEYEKMMKRLKDQAEDKDR